jgi:hypothetical protein
VFMPQARDTQRKIPENGGLRPVGISSRDKILELLEFRNGEAEETAVSLALRHYLLMNVRRYINDRAISIL